MIGYMLSSLTEHGWGSMWDMFHVPPSGSFEFRTPNQRQRRKRRRQGWRKYQ